MASKALKLVKFGAAFYAYHKTSKQLHQIYSCFRLFLCFCRLCFGEAIVVYVYHIYHNKAHLYILIYILTRYLIYHACNSKVSLLCYKFCMRSTTQMFHEVGDELNLSDVEFAQENKQESAFESHCICNSALNVRFALIDNFQTKCKFENREA